MTRRAVVTGLAGAVVSMGAIGIALAASTATAASHRAAATASACGSSGLAVQVGEPYAGEQTSLIVFTITNQGTATCTLGGFPTLAYTQSGSPAPGTSISDEPGVTPTTVTLGPGGRASFTIQSSGCGYDPNVNTNVPEQTAIGLPGDPQAYTATSQFSPPCDRTDYTLGPIVGGTAPPDGDATAPAVSVAPAPAAPPAPAPLSSG